jgi:hypothetical protein
MAISLNGITKTAKTLAQAIEFEIKGIKNEPSPQTQ